jgi:hypothetical protein
VKDLFKIDFDFLGRKIEIEVMTYKDKRDVADFMDVDYWDGEACCYIKKEVIGVGCYIIFSEYNFDKPYYYCHELLHATKKYLVEHFGIEDEEAECYFLGYLAKTYTDFLETLKEKEPEYNDYDTQIKKYGTTE